MLGFQPPFLPEQGCRNGYRQYTLAQGGKRRLLFANDCDSLLTRAEKRPLSVSSLVGTYGSARVHVPSCCSPDLFGRF